MTFPRRGVYRQEAFGIRTRFPFGFLEKTRKADADLEIIVYPRIEPTGQFYEVLPLVSGELESFTRGRGHDLYAIRDYQPTDSARHVDWKASAKTGSLQVREFTREDERRVMLVLDSFLDLRAGGSGGLRREEVGQKFERAVTLCACLAWHFYEIDSVLEFRTAGKTTPMAPAGEIIYDVLRHLALAQPLPAEPEQNLLSQLAQDTHIFKIILTSQPRGYGAVKTVVTGGTRWSNASSTGSRGTSGGVTKPTCQPCRGRCCAKPSPLAGPSRHRDSRRALLRSPVHPNRTPRRPSGISTDWRGDDLREPAGRRPRNDREDRQRGDAGG